MLTMVCQERAFLSRDGGGITLLTGEVSLFLSNILAKKSFLRKDNSVINYKIIVLRP